MEYMAYVIPAFLPVEHALFMEEVGMPNFFSTCSLLCDNFRQEILETGEEPWELMEAFCLPIVERHLKTCKSHPRQETLLKHASLEILDVPFIVPYPIHGDLTNNIMASEMAFLSPLPKSKFLHAVALQRTINIHQLPPNLTLLQLQALSKRIMICERSALSSSILYVCASCIMANQGKKGRGQCKYDLESEELICSICQSHSILSISTIGRIISLRTDRFYLAPCCGMVQLYTGRGDEFYLKQCFHKPFKKPKALKKRCELCSNLAIQESHDAVDHLTGEQHTIFLCQRHTPHSVALKHVTNWSQLQEEIRKRDRPLFKMKSK